MANTMEIELDDVAVTISGQVVWGQGATWDEPGYSTYIEDFAVYLDIAGTTMDITDSISVYTRERYVEQLIEKALSEKDAEGDYLYDMYKDEKLLINR